MTEIRKTKSGRSLHFPKRGALEKRTLKVLDVEEVTVPVAPIVEVTIASVEESKVKEEKSSKKSIIKKLLK